MLGPWLIGLLVLTAGPMAASLFLSFTDYDLLSDPEWVGTANYERMLTDPRLATSAITTVVFVIVSVPLKLAIALAVALAVKRGARAMGAYRAAYYLPSLLGASVAVAILWRFVFGADGIVNALLEPLGIATRSWISDPSTALGTLIALSVWQFGAPMVIFLAGLLQVPEELGEAASLDGAGPVRSFFAVTLPLLTPIVFFNLVLEVINSFQTFTPAFIVSGGTGAPSDRTLLYSLYLYIEAFTKFRMGYASAMAWLLLLVIAAVTALMFLGARKWVHYGDEMTR